MPEIAPHHFNSLDVYIEARLAPRLFAMIEVASKRGLASP
jgi:hypothetical protein